MILKKMGTNTLIFVILLILVIVLLFLFWKMNLVSVYSFATLSIFSLGFIVLNIYDRFRVLEKEAEKYSKKGDEALRKGDIGSAIEEYENALIFDGEHFPALLGLGDCYRKQDKMDLAIRNFSKACDIEPDSSAAHYFLGMTYYKTGKLKEALFELGKSLKLSNDHLDACLIMGDIYKSQGEDNEAIAMYEKFISLSKDQSSIETVRKKLDSLRKIRDEKQDV